MPAEHDDAICVRQWDWSETSQVVWVFARSMGMVRALAKGSKRPKAAYSGGLEVLTRGEIGVLARPGNELALLTEWNLLETYSHVRGSLNAYQAAMYAADLVAHLVHDHDPHPGLFDALESFLQGLADAASVSGSLLSLQWAALRETGHQPEIDRYARSGETLSAASSYRFSPSLGGVLADAPSRVASDGASDDAGTTWRVRSTTLKALRELEHAGTVSAPADPETIDRANRLLASYLRYVLGVEPPTMRTLFGARLAR